MLNKEQLKVICFDFGNTIIEFTTPQLAYQAHKLGEVLQELYGPYDADKLAAIRKGQILAPYERDYIENDFYAVSEQLITDLYNVPAPKDHVERLMAVRTQAFHDVVEIPHGVKDLLHELAASYKLAFISNYPCGVSIRGALDNFGIADLFGSIVISGEVGKIKPAPLIYETMIEEMAVAPHEVVYIGDNWIADVQGAKSMGMQSILSSQYNSYESFEAKEGDHQPDAKISHFSELADLLL